MAISIKRKSRELHLTALYVYSSLSVVVLVIIIAISFTWNYFREGDHTLSLAKKEALTNFNKDIALRYWASEHGGVYVPTTEQTPPNPYLGHIPERDIVTPAGKKLTLMNNKVVRVQGTIMDITEKKKNEELIKASLKEKETLLQEIHHRVKNNLTVVASLLNLQANSMEDESLKAALSDSQSRVQAMSAIHETLYQSENLSAIDMNIYLSKLGHDVARNYRIGSQVNLKVEAENISIGAKQASPIGLIINELITNSFKYAFPVTEDGEIKINLQKTEDQIELEYADNGIGMPEGLDWKNSDTLGLKLVRTLVENQLNGSINLESDNGTRFIIKFNINET
ncbi:MAG: sensor histidine kinase [Deltaproteobacteria bacterium]|nr:sensor histidine kinase [Deltaproteobacteria bacterium]MBT4263548.1 sensor histidine kinase [Deltaproteobacteria bacterium]